MKKILTILTMALLLSALQAGAKTASQIRVYINPGHGGWCGDCRPQNIVREVNGSPKTIYATAGDTTAFFESNTNLWKCLALRDKLESYGLKYNHAYTARNFSQNNICMSRIKTGPYPINSSDHTYNMNLSTICAEANYNNFDMFISVHSNANTDPSGVNYTSFFFRGRSYAGGDLVSGSRAMCRATWGYLYGMSFHKWTARHSNADNVGVLGDITFYQGGKASSTGYLGALRHNVPGYLAEGYFHTYQPARHRYMQRQVDVIEGYMYARGAADYFGLAKESTGDICGFVRSATETFSSTYYTTYSSYAGVDVSIDKYKGINGATVKLIQNGNTLRTFTTDNHYNGAFVFTNIAPGTYTVQISKSGYKTTTATVTVTAAKTAFPELRLTPGQEAAPDPVNEVKSTPLNNMVEKWNFSTAKGNNAQTGYDASKIRNFCYQNGKLYCVYDNSEILVLNAQTGAKLGFLDKNNLVGGSTLDFCDVKCVGGKIIACNLATAANNEWFDLYMWESDNAPCQRIYRSSDLRGCTRLGDCMEISGSWDTELYFTFCNDNGTDTQIVDITRSASGDWGKVVHKVMNPALTGRLGVSYTARAYRRAGGYWVDGINVYPTWCPLNSAGQAVAQVCLVSNKEWGTGFAEFQWLNDKYNASMMFNTPTSDATQNYTGGRVRLTVNNLGGYKTPITVAEYPSTGLGATRNGNTTGGVCVNTDSQNYVELWVCSTNQGLCYYTHGTPPAFNPSAITPPNTMKSAPLNNMVEKWNLSADKGTNAQTEFDTKLIRNFCYNNGKLYCVYNHNDILVLNAQTGAFLGFLDKGGVVEGGTLPLCDVKVIDNVIIACNLAIADKGEILRFYAWTDDNAPAQLIKTVSNLRGCARLGDCMELSGSWAGDMYLTFCNDNGTATQVVDFWRKEGSRWGADVYQILNPVGSARLGSGFNTRAYKREGGFWLDGYHVYPTFCRLVNATTAWAEYCLPLNQEWGTGFNEFQWLDDKYTATMVFNDKTDDAAQNCTGGRVRLTVNNERQYQQPIFVADYPRAGLGYNKNGNTTMGSWIKTDSKTYVEMWVQSTNQGICYYTYGTPPAANPGAIVPPANPSLSVDQSAIEFSCATGETAREQINVTMQSLTDNVTLTLGGADASQFVLGRNEIHKSYTTAPCDVVYRPTAVGEHSAYITISSPGANTVTVQLSGIATELPEISDIIDQLNESWHYTETTTDNPSWAVFNSAQCYTRDLQLVGSQLYVVNSKPFTAGSSIAIVDAVSGRQIGNLNVDPIPASGSRVPIGGITALSGKILACNSATSAHTFKVYMWDEDDSTPRVVIEDSTHGGITVGDQINASGTLQDGHIWVSNGLVVLRYDVTDGTFSSTPTEITLDSGKASSNGSVDICPLSDGSFWIVGTAHAPMLYAADGTCKGTLAYDNDFANTSINDGTGMSIIDFGERQYMAITTYLVGPQSKGTIALIDVTGTVSARAKVSSDKINGTLVGIFPEDGFGTTRNTQYQTAITAALTSDGKGINVYGAIPFQGVGRYYFNDINDPTNTSVGNVAVNPGEAAIITYGDEITAPAGSILEVYTTSGALMRRVTTGSIVKSTLPVGVYVVRAITPDGRSAVKKVALTR